MRQQQQQQSRLAADAAAMASPRGSPACCVRRCRRLLLVVAAVIARPVSADLPAHCLLQDVVGQWEFFVGPALLPASQSIEKSLRGREQNERSAAAAAASPGGVLPSCGHHIPNTVLSTLGIDAATEVPKTPSERIVLNLTEEIRDDGELRRLHVSLSSTAQGDNVSSAFWTMVFDEGFEVRVKAGSQRSFFAHFFFETLPDAKAAPGNGDRWDRIAKYFGREVEERLSLEPKGDLYACHCNLTSVGWWHRRGVAGNLEASGCFWGRKISSGSGGKEAEEDTEMVRLVRQRHRMSTLQAGSSLAAGGAEGWSHTAQRAKVAQTVQGASSLVDGSVVHDVRSVLLAGATTSKEVFFLRQNRRADGRRSSGTIARRETPSSLQQGRRGAEAKEEGQVRSLPQAWDWREVMKDMWLDGSDGLSEQFDQGNCGSCYAFSASLVLQMRFRIQLLRQHGILYPLELSWRSGTRCSPYTEGCNGGFAYLTFKYAAEAGLPEAQCDRSQPPESLDSSCDWSCYLKKKTNTSAGPMIFYAKDYGQTGGFAHGASEESIMHEIHKNGPVIVSFSTKAAPEFIYNNGQSWSNETEVMTLFRNDKMPTEPSAKNPNILPWFYTTHSILAVGWGEERRAYGETVKYWIVRNSWGTSWGTNGYAKIRRGHNDAALETSAPWVEPDMDRLPAGFLATARKRHSEHLTAKQASTAADKKGGFAEHGGDQHSKRAGGSKIPLYCKLRPDSPDCS